MRRQRQFIGAVLAAFMAWSMWGLAQVGVVYQMPIPQFFDNNGAVVNSGKLCTYAAGSTTPLATYSDSGLTVLNANPVILNSAGRPTSGAIFLQAATYKYTLLTAGTDATCSTGAVIWTLDNVAAFAAWNIPAVAGKVSYSAATVLTVTSNAITPTQNFHALDTSGGAVNLNTINTSNVTSGFPLTLYGNNPGSNPVTVKNGAGNIVMRKGDFALNSVNRYLMLQLSGSTWYEVGRSDNDGAIESPLFVNPTLKAVTLPSGTATWTLDFSQGQVFNVNPFDTNITTINFSNTGLVATFVIGMTANGTSHTVTWPAAIHWPGGTAPTITSTNGKQDVFVCFTLTTGAVFYCNIFGQNM
jgi:hypothetical protein